MNYYTKDIRKLPEPQCVQIGLTPGFTKCCVNVIDHLGNTHSLQISKRVAEVLLSTKHFSHEG